MLRKRKQLVLNEANADLIEDIEENTNFLIAKRQNRLRKTKTFNDKFLYHTITNDGVSGGVVTLAQDDRNILKSRGGDNSVLNKTIASETQPSHKKMCKFIDHKDFVVSNMGNSSIYQDDQKSQRSRINTSNYQYKRPSTSYKREDSIIYSSQAPKIKFTKKNNQVDDILEQLEKSTFKDTVDKIRSRNVQSVQNNRRKSLMKSTANFSQTYNQGFSTLKHEQNTDSPLKQPKMQVVHNSVQQTHMFNDQLLTSPLTKNPYTQTSSNFSKILLNTLILDSTRNKTTLAKDQNFTSLANKYLEGVKSVKKNYHAQSETTYPVKRFQSIEVRKVPNAIYYQTGKNIEQTRGLPEEFSPIKCEMIMQKKQYLKKMVKDVINNQVDHYAPITSLDKTTPINSNKITSSLVQVVQTDGERNEYQVYQMDQIMNMEENKSRFKKKMILQRDKELQQPQQDYPFIECNFKQLLVSTKDQISQQNNVNLAQFNYESIEQMVQRPLEQFLRENHIFPYYFAPIFVKKDAGTQVDRFEFFLVKGNQYLYNQNYLKALKFYNEGLKHYPSSLPFRFNKGVVFYQMKQYEKAKELFESIYQNEQQNTSVIQNLLLTLLMMGNYQLIMKMKDNNGLSRPRILMSQQQMSINKIIIYSQSYITTNFNQGTQSEFQVTSNNEKEVIKVHTGQSNIEHDLDKDEEITNQSSPKQTNQNTLTYSKQYFKKRSLTSYQHKRIQLKPQTQPIRQEEQEKVQCSQKKLITIDRQQFQNNRNKFNQILESKRLIEQLNQNEQFPSKPVQSNLQEQQSSQLNKVEREASQLNKQTNKLKKSSSLDDMIKTLKEATEAFTCDLKNPIHEKYKELMEDLRIFKNRIGFQEYLNEMAENKEKDKSKERDKPWDQKKKTIKDSNLMKSNQLERAKSFIKSLITNKSQKEIMVIIQNIEDQLCEYANIKLKEQHNYDLKEHDQHILQKCPIEIDKQYLI